MRHRNKLNPANHSKATETARSVARATLTRLLGPERSAPSGRHAAPAHPARIPAQKLRHHDYTTAGTERAPLVPVEEQRLATPVATRVFRAPETARWRASHLPRQLVAALLSLALVGTAMLGVRCYELRTSDNFVSLIISIVVVIILWAMLIASTPQEVTLKGSMLTVHNSDGYEHFDLADGMLPVDLIGDPRSSKWAVLLHRADYTSVVLRRHHVVPTELDPIVRHYRSVADQRFNERTARFAR